MAKLNLGNLTNLQNESSAVATINANNVTITAAMENTLSRDGSNPNPMNADLDMNSNQILNLPDATTDQEPVTFGQFNDTIDSIEAGAAVTSPFVTLGTSSVLTNERVLTGSSNLLVLDGGPGTTATLQVANPFTGGTFNSPTLVTPALGTPASGVATNLTGTALGLTSGNVDSTANVSVASATVNSLTASLPVGTDGTKKLVSLSTTGSGNVVLATSPTLVTPTIGVATATSVNKVAITPPATSATLTIPDGVTLTGPAASGTAMTLGNAETVTGVKTFGAAGNVSKFKLAGTTSGTTVLDASAVAGSTTLTLPAATDTLVGKATTDTLTNKTFDTAGTGNALSIAGVAVTANSGTGAVVRVTSPALVTPALGTPTSGVLTNATGLPLSGLTTQAAYTIVANNTGGAAVPTAVDVSAITSKASPVSADIILIQDSAASNAFKRTTVGALSSAGSVASIDGQTGALFNYMIPAGRISLAASPTMPLSASGATTVSYVPYNGITVPIYNGTNYVITQFSTLSQTTTDTTKSPAAVAASSLYDLFIWNDAGTVRCTRGPAWTSDTSRSAGTALVTVNGFLLNNLSITNGPAASRGTYVGTIGSNASSTIDYIYGTANTSGQGAVFNVFNMYNRIPVSTMVQDTTASWAYTTATYRSSNNSTANRVTYIDGYGDMAVNAMFANTATTSAGGGGNTAIGLDSTTTQVGKVALNSTATGASSYDLISSYRGLPGLGRHFLQAQERGAANISFNGGTLHSLEATLGGL